MLKVKIKLAELIEGKMSQRELSRLTGIRRPTITDMCNQNVTQIPLNNLAKICEVLQVDISEVLELHEMNEDDKEESPQ